MLGRTLSFLCVASMSTPHKVAALCVTGAATKSAKIFISKFCKQNRHPILILSVHRIHCHATLISEIIKTYMAS